MLIHSPYNRYCGKLWHYLATEPRDLPIFDDTDEYFEDQESMYVFRVADLASPQLNGSTHALIRRAMEYESWLDYELDRNDIRQFLDLYSLNGHSDCIEILAPWLDAEMLRRIRDFKELKTVFKVLRDRGSHSRETRYMLDIVFMRMLQESFAWPDKDTVFNNIQNAANMCLEVISDEAKTVAAFAFRHDETARTALGLL